jgi:hypothetical protein
MTIVWEESFACLWRVFEKLYEVYAGQVISSSLGLYSHACWNEYILADDPIAIADSQNSKTNPRTLVSILSSH